MKIHTRAAVTAVAATAAIVTSGCGSSGSGTPLSSDHGATSSNSTVSTSASPSMATSGSSANQSTSGANQAGSRCHTSMLSARVAMGSPGAGQRYANMILTNRSTSTCRVYGYPGMELLTSSGTGIPTNVVRTTPGPQLITVAPGGHVYSVLHWTVVPAGNEMSSPCEPVPSAVNITPPDETSMLTTAWPGGSVCQHGQIFVTAFRAGTGP